MAISFACPCGKNLKVAEEYAGKRAKCPACGEALEVPAMETAEEESPEDAAFRALSEGPDPAPNRNATRPAPEDYPKMRPPQPPAPPPGARKSGSSWAESPSRPSSTATKSKPRSSYDAPPERRWQINWPAMGVGVLMFLGGGLWLVLGLAAGRLFIYAPILMVLGIIGVIRGFLNVSTE